MMTSRRFLPLIVGLLVPASAAAVDITVTSGGSISAALAGASAGDRVLVQGGTYLETVNLVNGVELLGGYDGSFSDATRDPFNNLTTINGNGTGPAVRSGPTEGAGTAIDGFRLTSGRGPVAGVVIQGGEPRIANNQINQCRDGVAGGVYIYGGSFAELIGNQIVNNSSAGSGGGVRVESSTPRIVDNLIADNTAPHQGGGLYVFNSAVYCSSNVVRNCLAREASGGGAYLQKVPSAARFVNNLWQNCQANTGGGICLRDESFPSFENETFQGCRADQDGGGLAMLTFSEITVMNCAFEDCEAGRDGGGLWALDADVQVLGAGATQDPPPARFVGCTAGRYGGGLYAEETLGTVSRVRFSSCESLDWGGGMYVVHSAFMINLNVVEYCYSSEGGGIAIRTEFPALHQRSDLLNNTVFGCRADGSGDPGGGVTLASFGTENICNVGGTIIAGTLQGHGIRCRRGGSPTGTGTPFVQCSTFHVDASNVGGEAVNGARCDAAVSSSQTNQDEVDPLFCDVNPTDYSLKSSSPCAGTNCALGGGKVDRGAHTDGDLCPALLSVEPSSWGKIKSLYRQP